MKVLCAVFFYLLVTREKLQKRISYEKGANKILMKLTPGWPLRHRSQEHPRRRGGRHWGTCGRPSLEIVCRHKLCSMSQKSKGTLYHFKLGVIHESSQTCAYDHHCIATTWLERSLWGDLFVYFYNVKLPLNNNNLGTFFGPMGGHCLRHWLSLWSYLPNKSDF